MKNLAHHRSHVPRPSIYVLPSAPAARRMRHFASGNARTRPAQTAPARPCLAASLYALPPCWPYPPSTPTRLIRISGCTRARRGATGESARYRLVHWGSWWRGKCRLIRILYSLISRPHATLLLLGRTMSRESTTICKPVLPCFPPGALDASPLAILFARCLRSCDRALPTTGQQRSPGAARTRTPSHRAVSALGTGCTGCCRAGPGRREECVATLIPRRPALSCRSVPELAFVGWRPRSIHRRRWKTDRNEETNNLRTAHPQQPCNAALGAGGRGLGGRLKLRRLRRREYERDRTLGVRSLPLGRLSGASAHRGVIFVRWKRRRRK
ncbi:hypothetical protein DFH08DRAFT_156150 [Mycena albidolilacea]|uniref:Uncharacterized protein n=1 Tax=Mycena albidolilacea TaxID=1033008 RepID=A0AAD7A246_9AGAR|nr:hypothetical protein DFH08DRAFT_156150 [Mycena albidolilacea]